jgi:S1-C subfamily serine protease
VNLLDLVILALLGLGAIAGWRAGFLAPVLALAGALAAFALLLLIAGALRVTLASVPQPGRAIVALVGLAGALSVGEAAGGALGGALSRRIELTALHPLNRLGGALVGLAHVLLFAWILGGLMAAGPRPLAGLARDSAVLGALDERVPPVDAVAGRLLNLLNDSGLPSLFGGLEPPPAGAVELPGDAQSRRLARSALDSTARVSGTGCGYWQQIGSSFFVDSTHAVTNAHVVAGTSSTTLTLGGVTYDAQVVLFDPDRDIAVLSAPGADAPPLELAAEPPSRGDTAVVMGYPGGGGLRAEPAAVTAAHQGLGPDIYGDGRVEHSIIELRADVERGNSGGPLVVAPGVVGGVVFGESRTAADVGYAISIDSVRDEIESGMQRGQPADTGPCG